MWQVLCNSNNPYRGVHPDALQGEIKHEHLRPEIPDDTPDVLRGMMTKCWQYKPSDRPKMNVIVQTLLDSVNNFTKKTPTLSCKFEKKNLNFETKTKQLMLILNVVFLCFFLVNFFILIFFFKRRIVCMYVCVVCICCFFFCVLEAFFLVCFVFLFLKKYHGKDQ